MEDHQVDPASLEPSDLALHPDVFVAVTLVEL